MNVEFYKLARSPFQPNHSVARAKPVVTSNEVIVLRYCILEYYFSEVGLYKF